MSNNGMDKSNKEKSWLHSDIYDRPSSVKNPIPRKSIFKFGSFRDVISNFGKWIAQITLYTMIFPVLSILLWPGPSGWGGDQIYLALAEIIKLVSFTISVFIITKFFDDSDIVEIGLKLNRQGFSDFLFGYTIIFLIFALKFLLYWGSGLAKIEHFAWETRSFASVLWNMMAVLVIFIFTGWSEEILSRGFHLRIISKGLNRPLGIILSSAIFSYLHHNNPGITTGEYFSHFIFGIIMSFAFLRTGQLWLAMGLHASWDFSVAIFTGTPLSDLKIFHLFNITLSSQPAFYFLINMLSLAAIIILIRAYTLRRKVEIVDW